MLNKKFIAAAIAAGFAGVASQAMAQTSGTIAQVETNPNPTPGVSVTSAPVVTAIGSVAGTSLDGYNYTNNAIIAQDSTGSLELFGHLPTGSTYTPVVGDAVAASGTYSQFNDIPEIGSETSLTNVSTGNTAPGPLSVTLAQLQQSSVAPGGVPNNSVLGYYLKLTNVSFVSQSGTNTVPGNFPTHANGTYTVTDGVNSLTLFQYASSYSAAGALGGTAIPTGPVTITGIVDDFTPSGGGASTPEFIPFSITPEPTSLSIVGIGALGLLARRRAAK